MIFMVKKRNFKENPLEIKSFKIIFPYNEVDWSKISGTDDYDLRFNVEYEKYETYAQGYFDLFSLFNSPKRLFEDGNKSDRCGCMAAGAMFLEVNKEDEKRISIRIEPQCFYIPYFPYNKVDSIEQFLIEYSNLNDKYSSINHWKSVMQEYIDYFKENENEFIEGKRKEYFEIKISRTPIYFHLSISEYIQKIINLQETILSLPVVNGNNKTKSWFNETLNKNRQLLQKSNNL